jgi:hypothetical protein
MSKMDHCFELEANEVKNKDPVQWASRCTRANENDLGWFRLMTNRHNYMKDQCCIFKCLQRQWHWDRMSSNPRVMIFISQWNLKSNFRNKHTELRHHLFEKLMLYGRHYWRVNSYRQNSFAITQELSISFYTSRNHATAMNSTLE